MTNQQCCGTCKWWEHEFMVMLENKSFEAAGRCVNVKSKFYDCKIFPIMKSHKNCPCWEKKEEQ